MTDRVIDATEMDAAQVERADRIWGAGRWMWHYCPNYGKWVLHGRGFHITDAEAAAFLAVLDEALTPLAALNASLHEENRRLRRQLDEAHATLRYIAGMAEGADA